MPSLASTGGVPCRGRRLALSSWLVCPDRLAEARPRDRVDWSLMGLASGGPCENNVVPTSGDTDGVGLPLSAGAAGGSAPNGCEGSDPFAAGAKEGPELSSGVHATI